MFIGDSDEICHVNARVIFASMPLLLIISAAMRYYCCYAISGYVDAACWLRCYVDYAGRHMLCYIRDMRGERRHVDTRHDAAASDMICYTCYGVGGVCRRCCCHMLLPCWLLI